MAYVTSWPRPFTGKEQLVEPNNNKKLVNTARSSLGYLPHEQPFVRLWPTFLDVLDSLQAIVI